MKKYIRLQIALLFVLMAWVSACKNDDDQLETDRVNALLTSGTAWKMQSVIVDNTDQTSLYTGLQLTFTSSTYTAVAGGNVWPASGTWQFNDDEAKTIKRNDGVIITINEVTDTKLVLALPWTKNTLGAGRVNSISGQHVFTFVK